MRALNRGLVSTAHELNQLYRAAVEEQGLKAVNGAGFDALRQRLDDCLAEACTGVCWLVLGLLVSTGVVSLSYKAGCVLVGFFRAGAVAPNPLEADLVGFR